MSRKLSLLVWIIFFANISIAPVDANTTSRKLSTTIAARFLPSNTNEYLPNYECKIDENQKNEIRFPKTLRVLIYAIDFEDLTVDTRVHPDYSKLIKGISDYYKSTSGGRLKFEWVISTNYNRMPRSVKDYGARSRSNLNSAIEIIKDAQIAAFVKYRPVDFDFFIAAPPANTGVGQISTSVALISPEAEFINATILAGDYWQSEQPWEMPAHEIGHALGLMDLYSYKSANNYAQGKSDYDSQFEFMGSYDLMNQPSGLAPELTAWNRWLLGFLAESEIRCLPTKTTITRIDSIQKSSSDAKALFVKLGSNRLLAIEYRSSQGLDRDLPKEETGLLVYLVDLAYHSGEGPLRIYKNIIGRKNPYFGLALQPGERVLADGYLVENLAANSNQCLVRVQYL